MGYRYTFDTQIRLLPISSYDVFKINSLLTTGKPLIDNQSAFILYTWYMSRATANVVSINIQNVSQKWKKENRKLM